MLSSIVTAIAGHDNELARDLAQSQLNRLVQPFLLRRTKTQVLSELPLRIEVTVPVTLPDEEALLYEAARQRAVYVLHMDPCWNPAVEDQAADRAHRMGQLRPVTIYRFIARGTIEDKILDLHATKRDPADSLLEGTDTRPIVRRRTARSNSVG